MAHEKDESKLAVKVGTVALTLVAGWVAQQAVTRVWKMASGKDAPKDLDDPEVSIASAVVFAAVAAGASVLARRFSRRGAHRIATRFASKS